jgi:hypothetical protein
MRTATATRSDIPTIGTDDERPSRIQRCCPAGQPAQVLLAYDTTGRSKQVTDLLQETFTYEYDFRDDLVRHVDADDDYITKLATVKDQINAAHIPYNFLLRKSNSTANTMLLKLAFLGNLVAGVRSRVTTTSQGG